MKKKIIKIKIRTSLSLNIYTYHIIICDRNHRVVFDNYTKNGFIYFEAKYQELYHITIINSNQFKSREAIFITNDFPNEFIITLSNSYKKSHIVTIKLTDRFYKDLPIAKGRIIIWNT